MHVNNRFSSAAPRSFVYLRNANLNARNANLNAHKIILKWRLFNYAL